MFPKRFSHNGLLPQRVSCQPNPNITNRPTQPKPNQNQPDECWLFFVSRADGSRHVHIIARRWGPQNFDPNNQLIHIRLGKYRNVYCSPRFYSPYLTSKIVALGLCYNIMRVKERFEEGIIVFINGLSPQSAASPCNIRKANQVGYDGYDHQIFMVITYPQWDPIFTKIYGTLKF